MFHREANSRGACRTGLRSLNLVSFRTFSRRRLADYADYVLPATYFMERMEMSGVKWARDGSIYLSDPRALRRRKAARPVTTCGSCWRFSRRAFPERAARVGYKECKTAEEFNTYFDAFTNKGFAQLLAECDKARARAGLAEIHEGHREHRAGRRLRSKKYGSLSRIRNPSERRAARLKSMPSRASKNAAYVRGHCSDFTAHIPAPAFTRAEAETATSSSWLSGKNCAHLLRPEYVCAARLATLGDRTVWMNPEDAERLGISHGETVEVEGIDTGYKGQCSELL